ncbi:MAG: alpha/beta fold hydrolase [Burkholderiales bacterium]
MPSHALTRRPARGRTDRPPIPTFRWRILLIDTARLPAHETITDAGPDKPWLTLVHGLSQHSGIFSAQIPVFRTRHRLLLVDLPGHGRSSGMPGPYGPGDFANSVTAALDHVGIETTHFWGTHTGAGIGLLLAARQPTRFRSLVLDGAVLLGSQPVSVRATLARVKRLAATEGMAAALSAWFDEAEWFEVMRRRPIACRRDAHRAMIDAFEGGPWLDDRPGTPAESIVDTLPSIRVPALLVNGEHDLADFKATAARLGKLLGDARQVVVPEAGGFPLWETPERVNGIVLRFLEGR